MYEPYEEAAGARIPLEAAPYKPSPIDDILKESRSSDAQLQLERSRRPESLPLLLLLEENIRLKLFHQATDNAFEYLEKGKPVAEYDKVQFMLHIVVPLKNRLNPLRFIELLRIAADSLNDAQEALKFLDLQESSFESQSEAMVMFLTTKSYYLVKSGQLKYCEVLLLEGVQSRLNKMIGVDIVTSSYFHKACAALYKAMQKPAELYTHVLLYFAYTPMASIPKAERVDLAYDAVFAAIVSNSTFGFGELMLHPAVQELRQDVEKSWLYDLLVAFSEGLLPLYDEAMAKHREKIAASGLANYDLELRKKITAMALMEMALQRQKSQRRIAFSEVAEHCRLPVHEIELLAMRAMNGGLIKGEVDEVAQVLRVTWVCPRVLDKKRLVEMKNSFEKWRATAQDLLNHLEDVAVELTVN